MLAYEFCIKSVKPDIERRFAVFHTKLQEG